jgi:hypothetical protein
MTDFIVDDSNRDSLQDNYVNYLISRLNFLEIRESLRDYINTEKIFYSHEDLTDEIKSKGSDAIREILEGEYRSTGVLL